MSDWAQVICSALSRLSYLWLGPTAVPWVDMWAGGPEGQQSSSGSVRQLEIMNSGMKANRNITSNHLSPHLSPSSQAQMQ